LQNISLFVPTILNDTSFDHSECMQNRNFCGFCVVLMFF